MCSLLQPRLQAYHLFPPQLVDDTNVCFARRPPSLLSETVNDEMADFQLVSPLSSSRPPNQIAGFPNFYVLMSLESLPAENSDLYDHFLNR